MNYLLLFFPTFAAWRAVLMKVERKGHSLWPTELIDQVNIRLVGAKDQDGRTERYFFLLAPGLCGDRSITPEEACELRRFSKLSELRPARGEKVELVLTVDRLLDRLAEKNPEWWR